MPLLVEIVLQFHHPNGESHEFLFIYLIFPILHIIANCLMVSALRANGELSYCLLLNGDAAELLNGERYYCLLINGDYINGVLFNGDAASR